MKKVAIIGGGVAGLTMARLLRDRCECVVFEKESAVGGLIRCTRHHGHLFHTCGGHVFNSKDKNVIDWFWGIFDRDKDFVRADRNAAVCLDEEFIVPYPIEYNVYRLSADIRFAFDADLSMIELERDFVPTNFDEFLFHRFGRTLYNLYFKPYNEKVWRCDLSKIPLSWLDGKLPMPTVSEMRKANAERLKETDFVHSSFWYPKHDGSQFIANELGRGLDVRCGNKVSSIRTESDCVLVDGRKYDAVVYCGNIRYLPRMLSGLELGGLATEIETLPSHGTTSVLCQVDDNPFSWVYLPNPAHDSHRIINTGNFSRSNIPCGDMSATVEFTDEINDDCVRSQLCRMPFHPRFIASHYTPCSYPIQTQDTRRIIGLVKNLLRTKKIFLVGRFAEWEYYNMDATMASAMRCVNGWL